MRLLTIRRQIVREIIKDLKHYVNNACPHDLAFKPTGNMTREQKKALQESLNYHFKNWAQTWIIPWLDALEQETQRTKGMVTEYEKHSQNNKAVTD